MLIRARDEKIHTSDGCCGGRRDKKTVDHRADQSLPYVGGKPIQEPGPKNDTIPGNVQLGPFSTPSYESHSKGIHVESQ